MVAARISTVHRDETRVGLKRERGMRFKDNLEARVAESIDLLELHALDVVDELVDGTELRLGW